MEAIGWYHLQEPGMEEQKLLWGLWGFYGGQMLIRWVEDCYEVTEAGIFELESKSLRLNGTKAGLGQWTPE